MTTASTAQLLVETATATSGDQSPGDIAVLLPQALTDALDTPVQAAIQACNALPAGKLRKRQDDGSVEYWAVKTVFSLPFSVGL